MSTYVLTVNSQDYELTVNSQDYNLNLARTGGQGSRGDSISNAVINSNGDLILTVSNNAGDLVSTVNAGNVQAHITAGTGVSVASGQVSIGQDVSTSSDVSFSSVTTSTINGGSVITIDPAVVGNNTGEVIIAGDLTVQGTTTSVNSNEVNIGDSVIILNSDEVGAPSENGGIEIERGTSTNVTFVWDEANDYWSLANEQLANVTLDGGTY